MNMSKSEYDGEIILQGNETTMKYKIVRLMLIGVTLIILTLVIPSCTEKGSYSSDDIMSSFYTIAKNKTLSDSERQDYLKWWSLQIILGEVKHIKDDVYEIQFPDMSLETVEAWGIDMNSSKIQPVNGGALLSAIVLFCRDRNDQKADCQLWVRQLDALMQSLDK